MDLKTNATYRFRMMNIYGPSVKQSASIAAEGRACRFKWRGRGEKTG